MLSFTPDTGTMRAVSASPQDRSAIWKLRATFNQQSSGPQETTVIVPPQNLIQVLIGEDQADLALGNLLPPTGAAIVVRNRTFPNNPWPDTYNAVINDPRQFASVGTARYNAARTRATAQSVTAYDNAVDVAANVYGGVEGATLGGAIAFGSPQRAQDPQREINLINLYLNTVPCPQFDARQAGFDLKWFPFFMTIDEQVLVVDGIPIPTFVFVRQRPANGCVVIRIPFS